MTVDLLAIVAHPDDAELLCGGTLAKAAAQGHRVGILDLTAGEAGTSGSSELRANEAAESARILGISERLCAGLPDATLTDARDSRHAVARFIRQFRPRVVITHWPDARHPDHAAASKLAQAAAFLAGLKKLPIDGEPHRPHKLLYSLTYQETNRKPTFVVDITDQIQQKLDAILSYSSQFSGKTSMGDVVGGGDRPLRDQILAHHAHYGAMIRRPYGEPFFCRETVLVEDVVPLEPGSY